MAWLVFNGDAVTLVRSNIAPEDGVALDDAKAVEVEAALVDGRAVRLVDGAPVIGPAPAPVDPRDAMMVPRGEFAANAATLLPSLVTWPEAEAWATGRDLPAIAQTYLATIPAPDRALVRFELLTALNVRRLHPAILAIGTARSLSPEAIDRLFVRRG